MHIVFYLLGKKHNFVKWWMGHMYSITLGRGQLHIISRCGGGAGHTPKGPSLTRPNHYPSHHNTISYVAVTHHFIQTSYITKRVKWNRNLYVAQLLKERVRTKWEGEMGRGGIHHSSHVICGAMSPSCNRTGPW